MLDAWLELQKARHPNDEPKSPSEAAKLWASLPDLGVMALGDREKRELAERVGSISMAESGDDARPTVVVRDKGIGINPDSFSSTILSIHGKNKREKAHTHGAFGHGAATTLKFSHFTVLSSRLAPDLLGGKDDMVGATVVRFRSPRGPEKFGVYEYLASSDG